MRVGTVDPYGTVVHLLKPPFCANLVQGVQMVDH